MNNNGLVCELLRGVRCETLVGNRIFGFGKLVSLASFDHIVCVFNPMCLNK